jgi:ParB family chromosome partitioning protein
MPEPERDQDATAAPAIDEVEVDRIRGRGWRDHADGGDPAYRMLLASVRSRGVLVPLVVRAHSEGGYQLVSGARRLQAAREAGRATVPVVVRALGDVEALVGGAWAALTRSGISPDEAERLRGQLVAAGVTDDDAELLAESLPRAGAEVELTGRPRTEREGPAPAWAWGAAAGDAEQPRRGRLRLSRRSGR